MNARTEQLREQIEKSVKSERRGLKAREAALYLEDSISPFRGTGERDHPRYDNKQHQANTIVGVYIKSPETGHECISVVLL